MTVKASLRQPIGPKLYMIFPFVTLYVSSWALANMALTGVKMNVTLAMMLAFGIALLAELIRHRNLRTVLKSTTVFLKVWGISFLMR